MFLEDRWLVLTKTNNCFENLHLYGLWYSPVAPQKGAGQTPRAGSAAARPGSPAPYLGERGPFQVLQDAAERRGARQAGPSALAVGRNGEVLQKHPLPLAHLAPEGRLSPPALARASTRLENRRKRVFQSTPWAVALRTDYPEGPGAPAPHSEGSAPRERELSTAPAGSPGVRRDPSGPSPAPLAADTRVCTDTRGARTESRAHTCT